MFFAFSIALAAPAAHAATGYVSQGESGNGVLGDVPNDVAVEDASGRVFVADSENNRIVVFESGQPGAGVLTTFGEGELSSPYGVAIDQGSGDVYVSDAGNNRIVRYTSDGGDPPTYTLDAGYTSPAPGSGAEEVGSFASPIAIDPAGGDLLVADTGNLRVERFGADGGFLDSFDGADSDAGAFTSLLDIAVAPDGSIYVIANGLIEIFHSVGNSTVDRFTGAGTFEETVAPGELPNARTIAFDSRLDNLLVTGGGSFLEGRNITLWAVHIGPNGQEGSPVRSFEIPTPEECTLAAGLTVPGVPDLPISLVTARDVETGCGVASVQSIKGVQLDLAISQPSAVTGSSAHLSGTADPHGSEGTAHFEYRQVDSADWTSTSGQLVSGDGLQPLEADLEGLLANREYEVRLTAAIAGVNVTTDAVAFETAAVAPTAVTGAATGAIGGTATISGSVNPNGSLTTYFFEYGTTAAYGSRVPLNPAPVGGGYDTLQFSRSIAGLTPGATYHFRIVAESPAGTTAGDDHTFVEGSVSSEGRAYEQVTPVDSRGALYDIQQGVLALSGPTGLSYLAKPPGEGTVSAPHYSRRLVLRGSDGWETPVGVDPPVHFNHTRLFWMSTLAVSRDGTHSVAVTNAKLTPDAAEGPDAANFYRKDLRTGTYELIATNSEPEALQTFIQVGDTAKPFMEGSDDLSTVVFSFSYPLLPGAAQTAIYRWTPAGGLEVVSLLPGDVPPGQSVYLPETKELAKRWVTPDGSRILFQLEDGRLFMRLGDETVPVSVSELDGEEKPGVAMDIDAAGHYAYFTSEVALTADTGGGPVHLYRYDVESEDLEYIDDISVAQQYTPRYAVYAVSPDGQSVAYLNSDENMAIWHQGEVKVLLHPRPFPIPIWAIQFSTNSRYLAFTNAQAPFAGEPRTVVDGDVYLYDVDGEQLSCPSCIDGEPSTSAFLPQGERSVNNRMPQALDSEGRLFFTSSAALLPQDTNGVEDVYVYRAGQLSLITPGKEPHPAFLMAVSADGRDVYFATDESLVAQDTNEERDIYDARVGGGIPSQNTPPPAVCSGEGCRAIVPPPPSGPIGSESASGAGQPKRSSRHACKKGRVRRKGTCVKRKGRKAGTRATKSKTTSGAVR